MCSMLFIKDTLISVHCVRSLLGGIEMYFGNGHDFGPQVMGSISGQHRLQQSSRAPITL